MREEINYPDAKFTLVTESEEKTLVLYHAHRGFRVALNRQFDNEVDFKETVRSLKSKLQSLNDKIKELKNA